MPTDEDLARGWTEPGWYRDAEGEKLDGPHPTRRRVWRAHYQQVTRPRGRPRTRPPRPVKRPVVVGVELLTGARLMIGPGRTEVDVEADAAGRNPWCPRYAACLETVVKLLDAALRARMELNLTPEVLEKLKQQTRNAQWTCAETCPYRRERELPPRIVKAATMRQDLLYF